MSTTTSSTNKQSAIRTVYAYLKKYRRGLVIGSVCLFFANILMLIHPWILKVIIDSLKTGITTEQLLRYCYLFVGVVILSGVFRFLMRRIMIGISRKIEVDIREAFFSHLEILSPSFYMENRTGDLMALATNDLNAVRALFGPGVMYTLNTVVISTFAFSLMIALSWKLTLVSLLPMALLSIAVYHSVKAIHRLFLKVQEKFGVLNSRGQENLSGIRVVKAYAREDHEIAEFEKLSFSYVGENMKLFKIQSLLMPLLTFVAGLGALLILGYGGKQVIDGQMSLGSFVAFNGYLTMLIWPMIALGWVFSVEEAEEMVKAGAQIVGAMAGGITAGGSAGGVQTSSIDQAVDQIGAVVEAVKAFSQDILVLGHGGPLADPESVSEVLWRTGADGYATGSSGERVPVERGVAEAIRQFKTIHMSSED